MDGENSAPLRITVVETTFSGGGSAKVACFVASHWAEQGHTVTVVLLDGGPIFYPLHPAIQVVSLGLAAHSRNPLQAVTRNVRRIAALRKSILAQAPAVVVSFNLTTNSRVLLAMFGSGKPVLVCERADAIREDEGHWKAVMKLVYRRAAAVQCLSQETASWLKRYGCRHTVLIPNAVAVDEVDVPSTPLFPLPGRRRIAAMGRLHPVKGFDGLLEIFARLARKHPDLGLIIIGDGSERTKLESRARELGITERIAMPGQLRNPFAPLRNCDLFVLPSMREGFPNALVEAQALGLPAVAFDCSQSVRDIIEDGRSGMIVPRGDFAAMEEAVDELLQDEDRRKAMAEHAPGVRTKFHPATVLAMWDDLIRELAGPPAVRVAQRGTPGGSAGEAVEV